MREPSPHLPFELVSRLRQCVEYRPIRAHLCLGVTTVGLPRADHGNIEAVTDDDSGSDDGTDVPVEEEGDEGDDLLDGPSLPGPDA